uniref:Coluporin-16 n=1 Tax=Colubraria reticulata TaxID=604273 RepID=A0A499RVA2_9CAEN|nr:coluporin-16 [Colubraria reticulata]
MALPFPRLKTILVIFLFVIGHGPSQVWMMDPLTIASVATAAGSAVSAGSAVATATMKGLVDAGYRVTCAIHIENWTRYPLLYPTVRLKDGALNGAPTEVLPGKREDFAVLMRKRAHAAAGVYGTVSWEVSGVKRRFVIMLSAPYNFDFHSNWLALGMTRPGLTEVANGNKWFDHMYYGPVPKTTDKVDLKFQRKRFYYLTDPVIYRDSEFEVVGVMTNVHKAEIKIVFRPVEGNYANLAPQIRKVLGLSN